ncbi:MAG: hypothetical protein K0S08_1500 [Gammaproteobacteria bacterium]|nr:hypothetical protein [Gammaproteobacteria bacterium]
MDTNSRSILHTVMLMILIIGGINWGLVGLLQIDLVATLVGGPMMLAARVIYGLVGISAIYILAVFLMDSNKQL